MDTIRGHIKRIPELLAPKIDTIKTNFDEWKTPWTPARAEKIDTTADAIAELDVDIGETADTGGTQNTGTLNAKLNAILQGQKVIRGLAVVQIGGSDKSTTVRTIELPQTIEPEYANVSAGFVGVGSFSRPQTGAVVNVTSTTIEVRLHNVLADYTAYVEWQVVGGID